MAKLYNIKLYYNTGFNRGNVPGDASVLSAFELTARTFPAVFRRQSRVADIRIEATWDDVKDADYCSVSGDADVAYYVIDSITMESDHTATLSLLMDPLMTAGGISAITIVGGWAQRAHVSDDTLFGNITPEPWAPSQRMIIRRRKTINEKGPNGLVSIAGATCDLSRAEIYAKALETVASSDVSGTVVFPELPKLNFETELTFDGKKIVLPGVDLFEMDREEVKRGLNAVRSIGIESAITSMYQLPADGVIITFDSIISTETGEQISRFIDKIEGKTIPVEPTEFTYEYGSVKNKKACCLYNSYKIVSIASANSADFAAHDLYSGGSAPGFRLKFDPAPGGTVYCQPTYFEGKLTENIEHGVAGMPWLAAGFVQSGASGGALTLANARRANIQTQFNSDFARNMYNVREGQAAVNLAADLVKDFTDPNKVNLVDMISSGGMSAVNAVATGLQTAANYGFGVVERSMTEKNRKRNVAFSMGDNIFSAQVAANVAAPELAFPVDINASSYYGNAFVIAQITLGDNDLERFDRFLTMYGYAMDQRFEKKMLINREKFNYIKTSEAQITSGTAPMSVCSAIEDMFNNGVRIWHTAPVGSAYDDNPIKEDLT